METIEESTPAATMPTRDEEIVEMYKQGIVVQDICVELAISPPTLYYTLRRMGVRINRKKAHPKEVKAPTQPTTPTPPADVEIQVRAVGRPPNPGFTLDVEKVLLKDFEVFGSARKVAALNRLSYWSVLKFFRKRGIPLTVGSKQKQVFVDLVGNFISRKRLDEIRLASERLTSVSAADVSLEDFAAEYGISVATLSTIMTCGDEKAFAVQELQKYPAEVVAGMMNEVEARLRAKLETDFQPQLGLFDV
jgi:hypothetical protein